LAFFLFLYHFKYSNSYTNCQKIFSKTYTLFGTLDKGEGEEHLRQQKIHIVIVKKYLIKFIHFSEHYLYLTFSGVFLNRPGVSHIGADKNQKRLAILNQRKYVSKLTTLRNERKGIKIQAKSEIIDTITAKIFILTSLKFIR